MLPKKTSVALVIIALTAILAPLSPALSWLRAPGLDTLARIVAIPPMAPPKGDPVVPSPPPAPPASKPGTPEANPGAPDPVKPDTAVWVKPGAQSPEDPDRPIQVPEELPNVTSPAAVYDPQGMMRTFYEAL